MNRTIDRLKLIFLVVFFVLSAGSFVYHLGWGWPEQKCEAAGDWWDWRSRTCAHPIPISDITGRVIKDRAAYDAAKADGITGKTSELTRPSATAPASKD
ncbi:hypothetical protein [Phenylobacterium sp.]|uniref:hypothetical protein n=1 Tax=Phenylobacterium sp. TaxID=1871053 RepID=UPI002736AA31|nr:hypothetical protein [Phenylobacterium sp.]MDP3854744.1 hypothetical protein [Phenylobacterium sp.]